MGPQNLLLKDSIPTSKRTQYTATIYAYLVRRLQLWNTALSFSGCCVVECIGTYRNTMPTKRYST